MWYVIPATTSVSRTTNVGQGHNLDVTLLVAPLARTKPVFKLLRLFDLQYTHTVFMVCLKSIFHRQT